MEKVVYQLAELTCPSCLQKIEWGVSHQVGVEKVKVYFNASKVKAELDLSQTSPEKIAEFIENLGYEVLSTKVKKAA
jgi:copper chaperone CopZ